MNAPTTHSAPVLDLPYDLARSLARGVLVRVVTGSHLHGFAHAGSDHDSWLVVHEPRDHSGTWTAKKAFQSVERHDDKPDVDVTVVGLTTWLHYCSNGVPQALDVMFATGPHVEVDNLGGMRRAFRANPNTATPSYRRMMRQIVQERADVPKMRRHAFRLGFNLLDLQRTGRFNPSLSPALRERVLALAEHEDGFEARLETLTGLKFD
jgi:hypothetical protein